MRNGRVRSAPIGGRIPLSTKQSRAYRANTRKPRKPKGMANVLDAPIVFDIRVAQDAQAIEDFNLFDKLEADQVDENIFILPLANIGWVATTALAIMEAVS